jgi:TolB-like protein
MRVFEGARVTQRLGITMALLLTTTAGAADRLKLVVLPVSAPDAVLSNTTSEQLATELARSDAVEVVTSADLAALIGMERQRQLLGCTEESTSCMAELTAALGAPWVVQGSVGRVGGLLRLDVKLLRTADGRATFRDGRTLTSDAELPAALTEVSRGVLNALGLRPRSAAPLITLVTSGSAALVGAGLVVGALLQRGALATAEQRSQLTFGQALGLETSANVMAVTGWSLVGAGVAGAVTGLILTLLDAAPAAPSAWLLPTNTGAAVGGVW